MFSRCSQDVLGRLLLGYLEDTLGGLVGLVALVALVCPVGLVSLVCLMGLVGLVGPVGLWILWVCGSCGSSRCGRSGGPDEPAWLGGSGWSGVPSKETIFQQKTFHELSLWAPCRNSSLLGLI